MQPIAYLDNYISRFV